MNPFTDIAIYIELQVKDKIREGIFLTISNATGFLYCLDDRVFLVTNWHVLSGKNFIDNHYSNELLNADSAIPEFILFHSRDLSQEWRLPLFDEGGATKWHFSRTQDIDIAFIELSQSDCAVLRQLGWDAPISNDLGLQDLAMSVCDDVFVVGYPFGKRASIGYLAPIFKRGTLATSLNLSYLENRPSFIVDTTSRPGMSGSPVVAIRNGSYWLENGSLIVNGTIGMRFLGIYSGRIDGDQGNESCLGLAWRKSLIDALISGTN